MRSAFLAAVVVLTSSAIACSEITEAALAGAKVQLSAYESCVVGHAKSVAGSPEATQNIVKNAFAMCASARRALGDALTGAGVNPGDLNLTLNAFDLRVSQAASHAILEERGSH